MVTVLLLAAVRVLDELPVLEADVRGEQRRECPGDPAVVDAELARRLQRVTRGRGVDQEGVLPPVDRGHRLHVRAVLDDRLENRRRGRDRVDVVVDGERLHGGADGAHVGHRTLLLAAVDRVQKVRNRDGGDDADDRDDDEELDQCESLRIPLQHGVASFVGRGVSTEQWRCHTRRPGRPSPQSLLGRRFSAGGILRTCHRGLSTGFDDSSVTVFRPGMAPQRHRKKNGEDREALAVRIERRWSSYCWPPFGYWMNCPFWKQMSSVNNVVRVPATQPLLTPSLPGDCNV